MEVTVAKGLWWFHRSHVLSRFLIYCHKGLYFLLPLLNFPIVSLSLFFIPSIACPCFLFSWPKLAKDLSILKIFSKTWTCIDYICWIFSVWSSCAFTSEFFFSGYISWFNKVLTSCRVLFGKRTGALGLRKSCCAIPLVAVASSVKWLLTGYILRGNLISMFFWRLFLCPLGTDYSSN